MHPSSAKNFYSYNQNAFSSDNMRTFNKSPLTGSQPNNKYSSSIYSTMNNMQNLQSLKNQIQQLQSALSTSQQRRSNQNRASMTNTKDKSFYSLIKEQLKQVNQLQSENPSGFGNKVNRRNERVDQPRKISQTQQTSKPQTPKGSVLKNQSLIIEGQSSKQQALKQLLSSVNKENNNGVKGRLVQAEAQVRLELKEQLQQLETEKQSKLQQLKEEFARRKLEIELEYQAQVEQEIQVFEQKLKKQMEKRSSETLESKMRRKVSQQNHTNDNKHLRSASLSSSDSSIRRMVKGQYNIINSYQSQKLHLVSSLKKDSSMFKEKKQKVRFESDVGTRFKTESENSRFC